MSEGIKWRDTALSNKSKAVRLRLTWLRLSTILKLLSLYFLFVICSCCNLSDVCACAWFWLSLSKNFTSYLLNSTENTTWARNGHITTIIALREKSSYWPRLANTTAKKFLSNYTHIVFNTDSGYLFYKVASNLLALFSKLLPPHKHTFILG